MLYQLQLQLPLESASEMRVLHVFQEQCEILKIFEMIYPKKMISKLTFG